MAPSCRSVRLQFFCSADAVIRSGWPLWILAGSRRLGGLWNRRFRGGTVFLLGLCQSPRWRFPRDSIFEHITLSLFFLRFHCFVASQSARYRILSRAVGRFSSICAASGVLRRVEPADPCRTDNSTLKFLLTEACGIDLSGSNPFPESVRIAPTCGTTPARATRLRFSAPSPDLFLFPDDIRRPDTFIPTRLWRRKSTRDGCRRK